MDQVLETVQGQISEGESLRHLSSCVLYEKP